MTTLFSRVTARGLGASFCLFLLTVLPAHVARAQMGNDNPTGVSGNYNGTVNTAGSYDPFTGNATRSVTDIVVAGGVGKYPLAFTRTMNTRYTPGAGTLEFGQAGTWRHNYQWSIDSFTFQSSAPNKWSVMPQVFTVNYPDGRRLSFTNSNQDSKMRAGAGVSDRFQKPMSDYDYCYLLLPDGGKIWFQAEIERSGGDFGAVTISCNYTFLGIIDPHGQTTTISYGANTTTIQEPAGRWIQLSYITTPWNGDTVLTGLYSSDGRSITYNYGGYQPVPGGTVYSYLGNVQYRDTQGTAYTQAIYAYQPGNIDPNGRPLIRWAIDPMYWGPMWAIGYNFVPGSSGGVYGQLQSENYLDPRTGTVGQVVSSLSTNGNSRTETRGDGPTRTFNYSGGKLVSYTDFKNQMSSISYDGNGFVWATTDARGNTTTTSREGIIGAPSILTHPDAEHSTQGYSYMYANGGPYYVQIRGDERGHNTYFSRDPNNFQVTRIDYPDYPNGAYETFAYNGFGQVYSHRMTSGGTETMYYDGRGMLWAHANPDGTAYFYYDSLDRLEHVLDRRGKPTWFQYNARGQVTRITHVDGSFVQIGYDNHGNKTSVTDELNHTTTYAYDDYNRLVSVTNPLNQTTSYNYAQDWSNSYNQTTSNVKGAFSPMGKQIHYAYDENWQRTIMRIPPGSDPNDAWTFYGYDAAGNLTWAQDPRANVTTFGYDGRNRRTSMTNGLNQTTTWQYDTTSNVIRETRPDQSYREAYFDSMNRVYHTIGFIGEGTSFGRDLAGNITQLTDAKGSTYQFGYDLMNRKISATYPADATGTSRTETWRFDAQGNMDLYKDPAGQYQHLFYDDRNRRYDAWWDNGAAPEVVTGYDAASRVTSVVTNTGQVTGETIVTFHYDEANRLLWEDQTVSGHETHRLQHDRDADGNVTNTHVPGMFLVWYDYNQRNQLAHIYGGNGDPWFNYSYDAAGNMTKRQDVLNGVNDSVNVPSIWYDPLNRPVMWENTGSGDNAYARSWYQYDNLGREVATWRDEQGGKGERFGYNAMGQLTSAVYNADQVSTGNPQNAQRSVEYDVDALNRWAVSDTAEPRANGLSATYYSGIDLSGPAVLQHDATVNFAWNMASPAPGVPGEWFSARWEGEVVPRFSETYTFYTQSDDGVRLWVDGQLLVNDWNYHGTIENSGTITLVAGRKYSIRMEYFQGCCGAVAALLWSSPSQGKEVIPSTQLFAARPANGLRATYYDNIDFTGTKVLQTDATINFNWGGGSPAPAIGVDTFSARWEGQVVPRYSETYTFYAGSDDGVRLWVNGQLIVDNWWDRGYTEGTGAITLVAGQSYDIRMDFYENGGGAAATLAWSSASQAKEIVPQGQLFVPSASGVYQSNPLNQYTKVGGQDLGYDTRLNLTSYSGASFTYNAQNQLISASNDGNNVQFLYDGLGRCVKRTVNGAAAVYVFDGWKAVFEHAFDSSWLAYNVYGPGTDEILWRYHSQVGHLRYHTDIHGNVTELLGWSGEGLEKYTYDAFGQPTITDWGGTLRTTSAYGNRFMFQGREWLQEFGIYDFRNRHYQPQLGRFLQKDPLGFSAGDANLFRYCGGDPINRSDPFGLASPAGKSNGKIYNKESGGAGGGGQTATTDRVTVSASTIFDINAPFHDAQGWIDANSARGMLGFPNLGNMTLGDGSGSRIVSSTFTRDSNQLGTSPAHPFASSTQGWWTNPDGTPTGSSWVMNLQVQTAIEGGSQAGVKTFQSLTFNSWGQIVSHWGYVGVTGLFVANIHGWASFSAVVSTAGSQYRVNMAASSVTAVAPLIPGFAPIDYSFFFTGTFGAGLPTLSGFHDGYPSYTVWANGQSLYYHHETTLGDLRSPMEIEVGH